MKVPTHGGLLAISRSRAKLRRVPSASVLNFASKKDPALPILLCEESGCFDLALLPQSTVSNWYDPRSIADILIWTAELRICSVAS